MQMNGLRLSTTGAAASFVLAWVALAGSVVDGQPLDEPPAGLVARIGDFDRGASRIGVSIREVDSADVEREDLSGAAGAVVDAVNDGGPADEAGVRAGDIVVEFDGVRIRSTHQLTRVVRETPPGRTVAVAVVRNTARRDLRITPESGPRLGIIPLESLWRFGRDLREFGRADRGRSWQNRRGRLGIGVQDLTPQLAEYFGVTTGVLVTRVREDSAAAAAGLKAGDVVTAIDGQTLGGTRDLRRRLGRIDAGREFPIAVMRDRRPLTLRATLADRSGRSRRRAALRPI